MQRIFTSSGPAVRPPSALGDAFGRKVAYLRLSVTDRSNLNSLSGIRHGVRRLPKSEVLSLEELERLGAVFLHLGVRRIRLTGGEPLLRGGIMGLIERLGGRLGDGLDELALTTNGTLLAGRAAALAAAGVRRVNVNLDTLDAATFRRINQGDGLVDALAGIEAARAAGLAVRVNFVALAGINDGEFDHLIRWCGERGCDLALIEAMPGGPGADYFLPLDVVNWHLANRWTLIPCANPGAGPGRFWQVAETGCRLGFIAPLSHPFCATCDRVEADCTGHLMSCMTRRPGVDLRPVLRGSPDDTALAAAIAGVVMAKPGCHRFAAAPAGGALPIHQHGR